MIFAGGGGVYVTTGASAAPVAGTLPPLSILAVLLFLSLFEG